MRFMHATWEWDGKWNEPPVAVALDDDFGEKHVGLGYFEEFLARDPSPEAQHLLALWFREDLEEGDNYERFGEAFASYCAKATPALLAAVSQYFAIDALDEARRS